MLGRPLLTACICLASLIATAPPARSQNAPSLPRVESGRVSASIDLDGRLDEPAWREAGVIQDLTQQSPRPGDSTPYLTEVRILADRETLYLGFVCGDPDPALIAAHTMQRDGSMGGDDTVAVVLDTFSDRTTGYLFRVNAAGARQDGLVSGPEQYSTDWDGIWDAKVTTGPSGWTAEIAIPSHTIRFTPGAHTWGLNVERAVARDRLTLRWAGISLDARLEDLRRAGELAGLDDLRQGLGLSVSPYGLAGWDRELVTDTSSTTTELGGDLSYSLTPELSGVLTVNTDFAETEVDTRQINLTRFSLFFPEKRAFFLEGANQFEFGIGLGEDFIPFFSRRIGLYAGEQAPIVAGVKLIGRVGRFSVGLLDTVTDATQLSERTNLFAGRVTYDATEHLRVGAIATDGDPDGVSSNRLVGLDAVWRTANFRGDKNLFIGGWAAASSGDIPQGKASGYGLKIDYPNDLWDLSFTFKELGDALDPALGFLPRPGTRWWRIGSLYAPRPQRGWLASWVRQLYFQLVPSLVSNLDGVTESWEVFIAPLNLETHSGEHLELNLEPRFERLSEPFEIAQDVVIPPGDYRFTRYGAEVESSSSRSWRIGADCSVGDFFSGRLTRVESFVSYANQGGHLQLQLGSESNFGVMPEGDFVLRALQLKAVYSFTPDLVLSSYTQYDSESRDLGVNTRLRWTITPGTDLYLVWNHDWRHPLGERDDWTHLQSTGDQAVVKLRYTWRP